MFIGTKYTEYRIYVQSNIFRCFYRRNLNCECPICVGNCPSSCRSATVRFGSEADIQNLLKATERRSAIGKKRTFSSNKTPELGMAFSLLQTSLSACWIKFRRGLCRSRASMRSTTFGHPARHKATRGLKATRLIQTSIFRQVAQKTPLCEAFFVSSDKLKRLPD